METVETKGSRRWLQVAVNRCPAVIDAAIRKTGIELAGEIDWRSPLESDSFAEYWDSVFLDRLGIRLERRALKEFWPRGGPHWDGLARCGDGVFLVEAKAHISELDSSPCGAQPKSRRRIEDAMSRTRAFLGIKSETDWTRCFYQYANRLAHLYLLRDLNGIDAYLLNVYFVGDRTLGKPASRDGWEAAVALAKEHLGLPRDSRWLASYAKDVYIETGEMAHVEWP